ncbi:MAG: hypothetical protein GF311_22080 [Candidatus Lokiarchaeota archaeon]|nr:hypothetical protein [Candidatus Lokiarchaeota archaeon]
MKEIKNIIDNLGNDSLENNIGLAGVAVLSDSRELIHQTSNWDLNNLQTAIASIIEGDSSFILNDTEFSIVEKTTEGIIATNPNGKGYVLFVPFQGGVLFSYAMPHADPKQGLEFLKKYAKELDGKV